MGCCVSTSEKSNISLPPNDSVEEETVKEVLLETPKWNPTVPKFDAEKPLQNQPVTKFDAKKPLQKQTVAKFDAERPLQKQTVAKFEGEGKVEKLIMPLEISKGEEEISEVCSLSETISTTTLTEQEPRQGVHRSPATINKKCSFSGEFGAGSGKSPARRTEQSPSRRNVRFVQSRECQMGNGVVRNQPRRDNSCRRSMSPATRGDNVAPRFVVGRSPSSRRTYQSPARVRTTAPENDGRKRETPAMEQESLENPLVSLECFIFL
ncbi:hypothetical protein Lal_00041136 [Lupinus albus]|uniref:Uncharacterized protein n=1 Tax=Lupinus albus TaxID=3870 RepID=A0A6A4P6Y6_LUPAL|nr:hypothetical protein Lalb_Chr18g0059831 [Lupinus albus]KAF1890419.1 hypothetical protein Lal_00041136 [Lupinus albus]